MKIAHGRYDVLALKFFAFLSLYFRFQNAYRGAIVATGVFVIRKVGTTVLFLSRQVYHFSEARLKNGKFPYAVAYAYQQDGKGIGHEKTKKA